MLAGRVFLFQLFLRDIFVNHLTPPSEGKVMLKAPKVKKGFEDFFCLARRVHVIGLNLIAFIISVETEALLLAQQQKQQKQQKLQQQQKKKQTRVY